MEAKELRIGNLVQFESGAVYAVDIIYGDHIGQAQWHPIPINEERLLKCNVKKFNDVIYIPLTNLKAELHFTAVYDSVSRLYLGMVSIIKNQFGELILDEIKYIHQLQNLVFALTGTEFIIDL